MMTKVYAIVCWLMISGIVIGAQLKQVDILKKESSITYRIVHPLHEIEATSKDATYRVEIDPAKKEIISVSTDVDVMTFDSGNSNRDSHAMEVIDAISYPEVTFVSSSITQVGDSLKVTGRLTFHGVTQDIVALAASKWSSDKLEVRGSFVLSLTAFKIERPSLLMIPVEDALRFTFTAVFGLN
jgi:polyisoprenoid-binding protein YceI